MTNTNVENKMTITQKYDALIEICSELEINLDGFDVIGFLEDRKAKSVKSGTKAEKPENAEIRTSIIEYLGTVEKARISDVTKGVNDILGTEYTSNKVSAQMTKLKNDGTVVREVEKKIAYFSLATE